MDVEMIKLFSMVYPLCEEGHVIMDCAFVPFHIRVGITRHVELWNVVGALMDQTHEQESRIDVIHNRFRSMESGNQL